MIFVSHIIYNMLDDDFAGTRDEAIPMVCVCVWFGGTSNTVSCVVMFLCIFLMSRFILII